MTHIESMAYTIRISDPKDYSRIGRLLVDSYASLPGIPRPDEQPDYYRMLWDVGKRASHPAIDVFIATDDTGTILGSIDFIHDIKDYGSGGAAHTIPDSAGIRLLAVDPAYRGYGIGSALTHHSIQQARQLGRKQVILHTTKAMEQAWKMYEGMKFRRYPDVDFQQGALEVFGFRLPLDERDT